jgi:hypothetical protein
MYSSAKTVGLSLHDEGVRVDGPSAGLVGKVDPHGAAGLLLHDVGQNVVVDG